MCLEVQAQHTCFMSNARDCAASYDDSRAMTNGGIELNGHVILLACGTRGDVQPLALLADRLHVAKAGLRIDLVTHAAHKEWLSVSSGVQLHWLPHPPARVWANADGSAARNAGIRTALLHCCTAICKAHGWACRHCILCNLFSLEGFHLAERLGCSCMVVSPCVVPYAPPASFERRFSAAFPQLYSRLQDSIAGEVGLPDRGTQPPPVGWGEVEHWMWPLFTESWQQWREEALELEPVPFLSAAEDGQPLPPAPPLLYGLDESIVARPGYWPESVHMCGFWLDNHAANHLSTRLGKEGMAHFVAAGSTVVVDLGSMPRMGFLPDARGFIEALRDALTVAKFRGLVLTGSYRPLVDACRAAASVSAVDLVLMAAADVPHMALLPRCCAIMHHGGAGTTSAALAAGCPQLVCPFHFDQFYWAERVEDLGTGVQLPAARQLLAGTGTEEGRGALQDQLAACLQRIVQPSYASQCRQVAATLREQPDGLQTAVQQVLQALAGSTAFRANGPAAAALVPKVPVVAAETNSEPNTCISKPVGATVQLPESTQLQLAPGFSICTSCRDEAQFIFHETHTERCYLQHGITVNAGDVIIDCGANIGLFTLQLLLLSPAPAVIIAAEPLPQNLAVLQQNLALHADTVARGGCDVRVLPVALGISGGSRTFTYFPHMPGNSTALPHEKAQLQAMHMPATRFADQQTCSCHVMSISDLIHRQELQRVDLLKVDVEGMELEVLQGIALHDWPLIRQVVAEVHGVLEAGVSRLTKVLALLQSHGLECRVVPTVPEGNTLVYAVRRTD